MSPPEVTHSTLRNPDGSYSYRLHHAGNILVTSGPFLLERDAERTGSHFASDPKGVLAFFDKE